MCASFLRNILQIMFILLALSVLAACGGKLQVDDDTKTTTEVIQKEEDATSTGENTENGEHGQSMEQKNEQQDSEFRQEITISDLAFEPKIITSKPGTIIVWRNNDTVAHEIHAEDGAWHSKSFENAETYEIPFNTPGTYEYHCHIHPSMGGTITVEQAGL